MNPSDSQTIEQALFERMGISVDEAIAAGTDVLDEKVATAVDAGVDVSARMSTLGDLLEKLTQPETVTAIGKLLESLPQLVQLATLAREMPNLLATLGDVLDDYQRRCAAEGIDVEKAFTNGLQAALFLGTKMEKEHLVRIGDLLASDILNPHALNVVDNAAKSLNLAQQNVCEEPDSNRVGMFGLLAALRDTEIQRSLAFAVQFGKCFGKNIDANQS